MEVRRCGTHAAGRVTTQMPPGGCEKAPVMQRVFQKRCPAASNGCLKNASSGKRDSRPTLRKFEHVLKLRCAHFVGAARRRRCYQSPRAIASEQPLLTQPSLSGQREAAEGDVKTYAMGQPPLMGGSGHNQVSDGPLCRNGCYWQ